MSLRRTVDLSAADVDTNGIASGKRAGIRAHSDTGEISRKGTFCRSAYSNVRRVPPLDPPYTAITSALWSTMYRFLRIIHPLE